MLIEEVKKWFKGTWMNLNDVIIPFLELLDEGELEEFYNLIKNQSPVSRHEELKKQIKQKVFSLYGLSIDGDSSSLNEEDLVIKNTLEQVFASGLYIPYINLLKSQKELTKLQEKLNKLKTIIEEKNRSGEIVSSQIVSDMQDTEKLVNSEENRFNSRKKQCPINSQEQLRKQEIISAYKNTDISEQQIEVLYETLKKYGLQSVFDEITDTTTSSELLQLYLTINEQLEIISELFHLYKNSSFSQVELKKIIILAMKYNLLSDYYRQLELDKASSELSVRELDEYFEKFSKTVKKEHIIQMCNIPGEELTDEIIADIEKYGLYDLYSKMSKQSTSHKANITKVIAEYQNLEQNLSDFITTSEDRNNLYKKLNIIRRINNNRIDYYNQQLKRNTQTPEAIYNMITLEYDQIIQEENTKKMVVKSEIIKILRIENIPHVQEIIDRANYTKSVAEGMTLEEEQEAMKTKYTVSCMLKAFAIEYMLKGIDVLSDISVDKIDRIYDIYTKYQKELAKATTAEQRKELEKQNHEKISKEIGSLMQDVRNKLRTELDGLSQDEAKRLSKTTGHEINDLLERTLPPTLKLLIKQQSIINYADTNIRENGLVPKTKEEISSCFTGNYLTMIRPFSTKQDQEATIAEHQQKYKENNKAFEDYRYQLKEAGVVDEQMLNCLMASSYLVLEFLMNHPKLAVRLGKDEQIPFESTDGLLSENEYNHLLELLNTQNEQSQMDFNDMIYYHIFLKEYLKNRTPKFDDDRYKRINEFFTMIKETNVDDITVVGEKFAAWVENFDVSTLSDEELNEIKIFNPKFIFKYLSYYDKIIFKKCEASGVTFEYYYKSRGKTVAHIIERYASYFHNKSIPQELLTKDISVCEEYINLFIKLGVKIEDVPKYYYQHQPDTLGEIYKRLPVTAHFNKNILPYDVITKNVTQLVKENIAETSEFLGTDERDFTYNLQESVIIEELLERLDATSTQNTENKRNRLMQLINKIKNKEVSFDNYMAHGQGYTKEEVQRAYLIIELSKKIKMNNCDFYDTLSAHQMLEMLNVDRPNICVFTKMSKREGRNEKILETFQDIQTLFSKLQTSESLSANMLLLSTDEIMESINTCKKHGIKLEHPEYLLYKTPMELKIIINICKQERIEFCEEMLCYNFNLINKYTISNIKSYIDGVKATGKVTIDDIYNAINQEEHAENLRRITKEALAAIENSTNIELSLPTEKEEVLEISSHNQELFQMTSELDTKTAPSSVSTKKHETI